MRKFFPGYDGYSWNGETRVLNPFSLLYFFDRKQFQWFWLSSGTPRFLSDMIRTEPFVYNPTEQVGLSISDFDQLNFEPLMFQSGYLTIDRIDYDDDITYQLKTPNFEIGNASNKHILTSLTKVTEKK